MGIRALGPAALFLVLISLPMCNCPADDFPPFPEDAAVDGAAGPPDAGTPTDAERDSGTARDAGRGEWLLVPGAGEGCFALMARDPGAFHPRLEFESCPDKDHCRQVVMDWAPNERGHLAAMGLDQAGWHDGERGYFVFSRPDPSTSLAGVYWTMVAADDGEIVALWSHRYPEDDAPACYLERIVVGEGRYVGTVLDERTGERSVVGGRLADPVGTVQLVARLSLDVNFVRAGRDHIAVQTTAYHVYRLQWNGSLHRIDDVSGAPLDADGPSPVENAIVFDHFGTPNAIMISVGGGVPEGLVPPPADGAEPSLHRNTDGRTLAWLTGIDRVGSSPLFFDRVELWASPYSESSDGLSPVRLGTMENNGIHSGIWAGFGHAAVADSDDGTELRFFRVADGWETTLRAPPGRMWTSEIPYIGPREVVVGAGTRPRVLTAIQLIDYTALEPTL